MIEEAQFGQLKHIFDNGKSAIIMVDAGAPLDMFAAATGLAQSLAQLSVDVRLVTPKTPDGFGQYDLTAFTTELGHQSLTISFDYSEEKVDKISYHIGEETGKFYLTVKPKSGVEPLNAQSVQYSYTGAEADYLVLLGVQELDDLEQLYFGYEELFRNVPLIAINHFESGFGTIKLDVGSYPSTSQFVAEVIAKTGLTLTADAATHLLMGVEIATRGLQDKSATAETFETVAQLLRAGARRPVLANLLAAEPQAKAVVPPAQIVSPPAQPTASSTITINPAEGRGRKKSSATNSTPKPSLSAMSGEGGSRG